MIKLAKQTTEYFTSNESEALEVINKRKSESLGEVVKQSIEVKNEYIKLIITEEYMTHVAFQDEQQNDDPNEYYELMDENGSPIVHE